MQLGGRSAKLGFQLGARSAGLIMVVLWSQDRPGLAMETSDLAKDPYYMSNHLGQVSRVYWGCSLNWVSQGLLKLHMGTRSAGFTYGQVGV